MSVYLYVYYVIELIKCSFCERISICFFYTSPKNLFLSTVEPRAVTVSVHTIMY
jgi:hypothetical protein